MVALSAAARSAPLSADGARPMPLPMTLPIPLELEAEGVERDTALPDVRRVM